MASKATISFTIDTTNINDCLGFEARIDDSIFYNTDHVDGPQRITVAVDQDGGMHELSFILKNKTSTSDSEVSIKDLCIDDIPMVYVDNKKECYLVVKDMTDVPEGYAGHVVFPTTKSLQHWFSLNATYLHNYNGNSVLDNHKFYGSLGCNGTVKMKICLARAVEYFS